MVVWYGMVSYSIRLISTWRPRIVETKPELYL